MLSPNTFFDCNQESACTGIALFPAPFYVMSLSFDIHVALPQSVIMKQGGSRGTAGLQVNRLRDWYCTWGMIHYDIPKFISCPDCRQLTVQKYLLKHHSFDNETQLLCRKELHNVASAPPAVQQCKKVGVSE